MKLAHDQPGRVLLITQSGIEHASSRFRVHNWEPYLEEAGFECRVVEHYSASGEFTDYLPAKRLRTVARDLVGSPGIDKALATVDTVYCHEVLLPLSVLKTIRRTGKRLVFDFSDPIDPSAQPSFTWPRRWIWKLLKEPRFRATLECAAFVIVENDRFVPLIRAHGSRPVVMRGPVNVHTFRPDRTGRDHEVVLGWTGSPSTESYLQPLLPVLEKLAASDYKLSFRALGLRNTIAVPGLRVMSMPWTLETEPEEVAMFDIGISCIPENPWTRMRGGGKLLVYCASGLPIVSSPFGIGDQIIQEGINGFLPRNEQQWYSALVDLITNPELRRRQGDENRRRAEQCFSYEAYLPLMAQLLDHRVLADSIALPVECRDLSEGHQLAVGRAG